MLRSECVEIKHWSSMSKVLALFSKNFLSKNFYCCPLRDQLAYFPEPTITTGCLNRAAGQTPKTLRFTQYTCIIHSQKDIHNQTSTRIPLNSPLCFFDSDKISPPLAEKPWRTWSTRWRTKSNSGMVMRRFPSYLWRITNRRRTRGYCVCELLLLRTDR